MRAPLVIVVLVAGCTHPRAPAVPHADPVILRQFAELAADPKQLDAASIFAERHRLTAEERVFGAMPAYREHMRAEAYVLATEVAWRFGFERSWRTAPAVRQRARTLRAVRVLLNEDEHSADTDAFQQVARAELSSEALIGCVFSRDPFEGRVVVQIAIAYYGKTYDTAALVPLLAAGCPLQPDLRDTVINHAFLKGMDAYVIREVARAGWDEERKALLVGQYFTNERCTAGFQVAVEIGAFPGDVARFIQESKCESTFVSNARWALRKDVAQLYFFTALRSRKFNLVLALLPFCGFDENGELYVFQEALRYGAGGELARVIQNYYSSFHEPFIRYAYDQGRYRFVGMHAVALGWQRMAFDKLIEGRRYDFAAEVAEFGFGQAFRIEGVLLAFRAAMKDGDFNAARYLLARYGPMQGPDGALKPGLLTRAMYDEGLKTFYTETPSSRPNPPVKRPFGKRARTRPFPRPSECTRNQWYVRRCN